VLINEKGSLTLLVPTVSKKTMEFESMGRLIPSRWHLVSISLNSLNLEISLNGLLDSSFKLNSDSFLSIIQPTPSSSTSGEISDSSSVLEIPVHLSKLISEKYFNLKHTSYISVSLGKSSIYPSTTCFIDEIRFFNQFLSQDSIRKLAISEGVPFVDEEIRIGCLKCTFSEASKKCSKDFHLCTQQEIFAFAFQVARINGWTQYSKKIWTFSPITDELINSKDLKLGLCCKSSLFTN
jgi:hypothetical protein